jgi:hypothetical protein
VKLKTREAIIGLVVYRVMRFVVARYLRKESRVATKKRVTIVAALSALVGALLFWRKRKTRQSEF